MATPVVLRLNNSNRALLRLLRGVGLRVALGGIALGGIALGRVPLLRVPITLGGIPLLWVVGGPSRRPTTHHNHTGARVGTHGHGLGASAAPGAGNGKAATEAHNDEDGEDDEDKQCG